MGRLWNFLMFEKRKKCLVQKSLNYFFKYSEPHSFPSFSGAMIVRMLDPLSHRSLRFWSFLFYFLPLVQIGSFLFPCFQGHWFFLCHMHYALESIQCLLKMSLYFSVLKIRSYSSIFYTSVLRFCFIFCFKHGCNCSFYGGCLKILVSHCQCVYIYNLNVRICWLFFPGQVEMVLGMISDFLFYLREFWILCCETLGHISLFGSHSV